MTFENKFITNLAYCIVFVVRLFTKTAAASFCVSTTITGNDYCMDVLKGDEQFRLFRTRGG